MHSANDLTIDAHVLDIDCDAVTTEIANWLREQISRTLHRRGAIVAVSGGVDSAVCAALAIRALGSKRVFALLMPEQDSPADDTARGVQVCETYGIEYVIEDITPTLEALGCYRRRDKAIRELFPEYGDDWRCKISLADGGREEGRVNYFDLTVQSPEGQIQRKRMPLSTYLGVVAATNMKQRTRKLLEYHHAERLNYAVLGTPNRLEYELGFFVRGGDGLADVKPIAHLYKTQVYALARHLGVSEEIIDRRPDTGTYSLPQTQEEFFFGLPIEQLDLLLYTYMQQVPAIDVASGQSMTKDQVRRIYLNIEMKRRQAEQLTQNALLMSLS